MAISVKIRLFIIVFMLFVSAQTASAQRDEHIPPLSSEPTKSGMKVLILL